MVVTGATGFVGTCLSCELAAAGHAVVGLGRDRSKGALLESAGVSFLEVDLLDRLGLRKALRGADAVVHAAALSSVWGDYEAFRRCNVDGTGNVVEACRANEVEKLVFVSSSSVYFDFKDRLGIVETDELARSPASAYTRSKKEAEQLIASIDDVNWIVLRPRGIFGPGDSAIVPRALRLARKGFFPLVRGGEALVDLTYVENLAHAIRISLGAEKRAWNEFYNISNGEPVRIVDFFDRLMRGLEMNPKKLNTPIGLIRSLAAVFEDGARVLGLGEPPLTRYTAGLLSYSQTLSIEKAKALLGYSPMVSMSEGIERTVQSLREGEVMSD